MSSKIFISYKYYDINVYQDKQLDKIQNPNISCYEDKHVTPRSYVNALSDILSDYAIEKWEKDNEDLSVFTDATIESKLKDKIFDSTITIVLISPTMKDVFQYEKEQWIPWEVSYSLKEVVRNDRTSKTNAVIAIVLPDENNNYSYCLEEHDCHTTLKFNNFFTIIGKNFFNNKKPNCSTCDTCGKSHYVGNDNHYFVYAKWVDFKENPKKYIDLALKHQKNKEDYTIRKEV